MRKVDLPPLGTSQGLSGNPDEDTAYFAYTSFTEPQIIYKTSIATGKVDRVGTDHAADRYVQHDGRAGVLSVEGRHEDLDVPAPQARAPQKTGSNPTILYGYGGFNVNMTPAFASSRAVWLERGGVYAIPNLRGGGEYGEDWHRAGMLLDQAERVRRLHRRGRVSDHGAAGRRADHLAISGGSNGGLLVGAAITQRPDLCKAAICAVPLLDMLRYHL